MKKCTYMYKTEISGNIPHFHLCCDFLTNQVQQEISHEPYRVHGAPWCSMVPNGAPWLLTSLFLPHSLTNGCNRKSYFTYSSILSLLKTESFNFT